MEDRDYVLGTHDAEIARLGAVIAVEQSGQLAAAASAAAQARGMTQIAVHEADLLATDLGTSIADASWCRWVLSFASDPSLIVAKLRRALKPGPQANGSFDALT